MWQWDPDAPKPELPVGGIMVLGHDFHSETGYKASLARGAESRGQPTWRHLVGLLEAAQIHPGQCFFTNVFMGLREGAAATGRFPGAMDRAFVRRCLDFLRVQVGYFRPSIILTLGRFVPSLLAELSDDLRDWRGVERLGDIDSLGPFRPAVRVHTEAGIIVTAVAALTHPSQRRLSVGRRQYRDRTGHDAELAMLADVCRMLRVY